MDIKIKVPVKEEILSKGVTNKVAPSGTEWSGSLLGDYRNKSGVYIHHSNNKILYVGKTTSGNWGTFAERFRRQFQEKASGNSGLYKLFFIQTDVIKTVMFDFDDIDMMFDNGSVKLSKETKALILEQVLIGVFQPPGNINGINPVKSLF